MTCERNVSRFGTGLNAVGSSSEHLDSIDFAGLGCSDAWQDRTDLATARRRPRPELRVILISACSQGLLMLETGWNFLQKPFLPSAILETVQQTLNTPRPSIPTRVKDLENGWFN